MNHAYVSLGGPYVAAGQSLLVALAHAPARFRKHVGLRSILLLLLHQLGIRKGSVATVELPVAGDACKPTQQGYTVFRFRKNTVVEVFLPKVETEVFEIRLEALRRASRFSWVPKLLDASASEQWLEIEYVPGKNGRTLLVSDSESFLDFFQSRLLRVLTELTMSEPIRFIPCWDYVRSLLPLLEGKFLAKWAEAQRRVRSFVQRQTQILLECRGIEMAMSYTHGDFVHVNMIDAKDGIRVIDWHTAGWRSLLHDTHTIFFAQAQFRRQLPPPILEEAIGSFVSALPAEFRSIDITPQRLDAYRRIWYLERLAMLLQRKQSRAWANWLIASISSYEQFEQEVDRPELAPSERVAFAWIRVH